MASLRARLFLHGAALASGIDGRDRAGSSVCQGGLYRVFFAGDEPRQRRLRALHHARGLERAGPDRIAADWCCYGFGRFTSYQAVYAESILQKILWAYTIYSAALTPEVPAAFYSKG